MNIFFKYGVFGILFFTVMSGCNLQKSKRIPSLTETYRSTDKLPFGSYVAYKGFQAEFPDYWINIADKPFNKTWADIKNNSSKYSLYFLVTKNLILSADDVNAMIEYIKAGNDLFISADYIDIKLLKAFYCSTERKNQILSEVNGKMNDTHVSMFYDRNFKTPKYGYYYFPFLNYFSAYDTSYARVLGVNEKNLPDYLIFFSGKGRLYLHLAPRVFSNYFLLTGNNYEYFEYITAYLRFDPQYVYWDEYYKGLSSNPDRDNPENKNNTGHFSSLSVIEKNPSLLWAFCIAFAGILLFTVFNIKRKQRIIDPVKPNSNSTIAFTETVGRLYLKQKNNKNISEKMITYFYEYLRKKYFISTSVINSEFVNSLSGKSGIPQNETNELFELINNIQLQQIVTDAELIALNEKIDLFKKNKN